MTMRMLIVLGSGLTLGMIASHGCAYRELDLTHCAHNEGDAYCAEKFPDGSRPYCQRGTEECYTPNTEFGCVAAEDKPADECYSPCGGRGTVLDNGECLMMEDSSSGSSSSGTTTEESGSESSSGSSTTGPMPCLNDEECTAPEAPFCGTSGECGTCDGAKDPDGACAGLDPGMPLCVGEACVQCTAEAPEACTGETPVCDDATNTCVPCTEHDQCGEAACNLFTGACLPGDAVVHVGAGQVYATIGAAVTSFDMMTQGTIIVHAGSYNEAVTVNGGRVLAFLVNVGDLPEWDTPAGNPATPQLTVTDATVLMDGLQLSGNGSSMAPGLRVDAGQAWLDRSRIVANTGGGIEAQNAADLVLRNCFVGQDVNNTDALVIDGASANVLYTTLASGTFNAAALRCTTPISVDVRNTILVTQGGTPPDEVECPSASITYSATEGAIAGDGNASVGMFPGGMAELWFADYAAGDFGLQNEGLTTFADVAQWQTGDPPTDVDGDPRPAVDGTADFAGADVP